MRTPTRLEQKHLILLLGRVNVGRNERQWIIELSSSAQVSISKLFIADINEGVGYADGLDKCFTLCMTSKSEGTHLVHCHKLQNSN